MEDLDTHLVAIGAGDRKAFAAWVAGAEMSMRASLRRYASLVLQQDRMVRDGNEGGVFEDAIQQEEGIRTFAARALLAHCANHTQSHAKTITAHYL